MNHCYEIRFIVNEACHQITINYKNLSVEIITEQVLTDDEKEYFMNTISRCCQED